ncbi:MAG: copper resistance system multicopper oxidase [bacterium]|nr:copper resistance system multicopper oxidase [bacterium]
MGFLQPVVAKHHTLNLIVQYKAVYFAGKTSKAITVNGKIPAPTLHFKQGDRVTINVFNHLDKETAIHWHGLILPWQMDGVLGVTQHGIPPGGVFHYQFSLQQSGTYWYHAHAGLQEQQGLYGAFLIDPTNAPSYKYTKDVVVVLSDWSNTAPEQILANLKKEGDYYSPKFPLQPSLTTFIDDYHQASNKERKKIIADYKMMQQMRMGIYDLSDVAYDAFLLNGKPHSSPWTSHVKKGDIVRLRFIGAAGSTIFNVKIPGTTMQMVHVQGNDVTPYLIDEFKIAPGETYDVLIKIQHKHPYIIYAESIDTLGAAYGALVTDTQQKVNYQEVTPFPKPLPPMRNMMSLMMGTSASSMNEKKGPSKPKINSNLNINPNMKMDPNMNMDSNMNMDPNMNMNSNMNMSMLTEANILGDKLLVYKPATAQTIGTKYQDLKAAVKTNDPTKPVYKVIKMELFGYMDRYIWFINGVPEDKAVPIRLAANKRYRFIFTNPSMMRHPMHMHGHWFILRNGHASYDPLLHTIDVPPGATVTADLDTDVSGQWLFHCHLIYHMMSGMSRIVQYDSLIEIIKNQVPPEHIIKQTAFVNRPIIRVDKEPIDRSLVHHPMPHLMGLYLANYLDLGEDPFNNSQKLTFKGLYGRNYQKLQLYINDAEVEKGKIQSADVDIFYWQLVNQFWAIKAGINYFNRPAQTPYWQPGIGIEGLMPYFIDTNLRAYYFNASFKLDAEFSRNSQITNNFFIRTGIRSILASKTVSKAAIGAGLNQMRYILRPYYRLMPGVNIFSEYEYQRAYGTFKNLEIQSNEPSVQKTITVGLAMLF